MVENQETNIYLTTIHITNIFSNQIHILTRLNSKVYRIIIKTQQPRIQVGEMKKRERVTRQNSEVIKSTDCCGSRGAYIESERGRKWKSTSWSSCSSGKVFLSYQGIDSIRLAKKERSSPRRKEGSGWLERRRGGDFRFLLEARVRRVLH